jgi:predicted transcriptional regulator
MTNGQGITIKRNRELTLIILGLMMLSFFLSPMEYAQGDTEFKQIHGNVIGDSGTGVRAYHPDPAQNGFVYYYIVNRTNEGNGTDPMKTSGGIDYYDPVISNNLTDWQAGDTLMLIVEIENGDWGIDRAGYIAYTGITLDASLAQMVPDIVLQKIPAPIVFGAGPDFINITWTPFIDIHEINVGYKVYRSTTNGTIDQNKDWKLVGGDIDNPVPEPYFNDTTVLGGFEYYYAIKMCFKGNANNNIVEVDNYENRYLGEGSSPMHSLSPPPTVDYIEMTDVPEGIPLDGGIVPINYQEWGYCSLYNYTYGFIDTVTANWTAEGGTSSLLAPSPGETNGIDVGNVPGFVYFNATYGLFKDSIHYFVTSETVDYIEITDFPDGFPPAQETVSVGTLREGYCSAYNNTSGYLGSVNSNWTAEGGSSFLTGPTPAISNEIDVGIKAAEVWFNVSYGGFSDSVLYTVIPPTIDNIQIRDEPNGLGKVVTSRTYSEGEIVSFWAAGYNQTADYARDVDAQWESDNTAVGTVTSGPNEYSNFSAQLKGGVCRITITYDILTNITGDLYVININQLPTASGVNYSGTGFSGGRNSFLMDITLRVTGRKDNTITMDLEEDGIVVDGGVVTRTSAQPDVVKISYEMDVNYAYDVILNYNGASDGSNPVIVTFEFLENIYSVSWLFASQKGLIQDAQIDINDILQNVGMVFFDSSPSTDIDGYLTEYHWDFGDGTTGYGETLFHVYERNGVYTAKLQVMDDEGGINETIISVDVNNIDNNNQVHAILAQNGIKGFLNYSGYYAVVLQCPADLLISNLENQVIGLENRSLRSTIEGAFFAMLYSDVEVYFIPSDEFYNFDIYGNEDGQFNFSVIDVEYDDARIYSVLNVSCTEGTLDSNIVDFTKETISLQTTEDDKQYSLKFEVIGLVQQDHFILSDMNLDTNQTHIYKVKNWEVLSSGKPVTFQIDENNDGDIDKSIDLQSGLKGEEVEALILKEPVGGPFLPIELIIVVGFICIIGIGTLLTEIGKWALLSLFIPLYSKIKKGDLLNHPVRHRVHGYIIGNPGAHFALIKQDLNLGNGQLIYHLKRLRDANLIYSKEDGIKKRFYPFDFPRAKTKIYILNEIQEKIFGIIQKRPGISQKKIANSTGISRQVAGYHLTKLEEEGIIKKEVDGRKAKYYTSEKAGA